MTTDWISFSESMQGITIGDIVSVSYQYVPPFSFSVTETHAEGVVLSIDPFQGLALVEVPIPGTKRSYFKRHYPLYALTPIG